MAQYMNKFSKGKARILTSNWPLNSINRSNLSEHGSCSKEIDQTGETVILTFIFMNIASNVGKENFIKFCHVSSKQASKDFKSLLACSMFSHRVPRAEGNRVFRKKSKTRQPAPALSINLISSWRLKRLFLPHCGSLKK